jgi:hypothetical protein
VSTESIPDYDAQWYGLTRIAQISFVALSLVALSLVAHIFSGVVDILVGLGKPWCGDSLVGLAGRHGEKFLSGRVLCNARFRV